MNVKKQRQPTSVVDSIFTKVLYSPQEAMELIGISRPTLYREIKRGALRLRKIGRKSVFHADDLVSYVDALPSLCDQTRNLA